jgi:hypothetical protein
MESKVVVGCLCQARSGAVGSSSFTFLRGRIPFATPAFARLWLSARLRQPLRHLLPLFPRHVRLRLSHERAQRRDHRLAADALQHRPLQPADALVLVTNSMLPFPSQHC